jgi:hypothetical protein
MSTTINLISFDKQLADINFSSLISGSCDFVSSLNDFEPLKNYLSELNSVDEVEESMRILRMIYLYCGSLYSTYIDSPLGDDQHMCEIWAFSEYYKLDLDNSDIPTKNGFIDLYKKINSKDIDEITNIFLKKIDYDFQDGKQELIHTLKYLRPLVVSLKGYSKSYLVVDIDHNSPEVSPQEINDYIIKKIEEAGPIQGLVKKININT